MSTSAPVPESVPSNGDLLEKLAALRSNLVTCEATLQLADALRLAELRRGVADVIAATDRRQAGAAWVQEALTCVRAAATAGILDLPLDDDDRDRLAAWEKRGWPGTIASMLLTAAWRWSSAPGLGQVPDWMWGDYAEWLFAAPNPLITAEDCAIYSAHLGRHADELARWAEKNIGSTPVRAAADAFARLEPLRPLRFAPANARPAAEARARILTRVHGRKAPRYDAIPLPRAGRPLRVGFVARSWDNDSDTAAALACFEQAPADRMEAILFSSTEPASAFGAYCRERAKEFHLFSPDIGATVTLLREANLDVVVFVGDVSGSDAFSILPLFRVSTVQGLLADSLISSGAPGCDLRLGGGALRGSDAAFHTERLCVLPPGATAYALRRGVDTELAYAREDLGFTPDAVIVVAVLPGTHGVADSLQLFASILNGAPAARLVLHVLPDAKLPNPGLERFCAVVETAFAQAGVAAERVSILAPSEASCDETRAIVRLADIYMATPGACRWSAEALSVGIPIVACTAPETEWLEEEGLMRGNSSGSDDYVRRAVALVQSAEERAGISEHLKNGASSGLACADVLSAADGFLGVIEDAYDVLESQGVAAFRRGRTVVEVEAVTQLIAAAESALGAGDPVRAADQARRALAQFPRNAKVRALLGRALLAEGRAGQASRYLLAAVAQTSDDAGLWFDLATAFRDDGQKGAATQALENALRLDPKRAEGWLMLIELAEGVDANELARDAYHALKAAFPQHPRLPEFAGRYDS